MKVVMISTTPLAGAPYETMRCLRKYAGLDVRWVAGKDRYLDGRVFPSDLVWHKSLAECHRLISEADVIHLHNDTCYSYWNPAMKKKVIGQIHSVPKRLIFDDLAKLTKHMYTIEQPMQMKEYGLPALPNLMDSEEYTPKKVRNEKIRVLFAPTNKWPANRVGSKGYQEVLDLLKRMQLEFDFELDHFTNLPYEENLRRKQLADIIIDDVVNMTFHKTTIEGCCFGTAVLTNVNSGGWLKTCLSTLYTNLSLLLNNQELLQEIKLRCREWAETTWHPRNLVGKYVEAYEKVLKDG